MSRVGRPLSPLDPTLEKDRHFIRAVRTVRIESVERRSLVHCEPSGTISTKALRRLEPFSGHRSFAALQPPHSLLRRGIERDVLPFCDQQGLGVMAYGTLAHGLLTVKYDRVQQFIGWRSTSPLFQSESYDRNVAMAARLAKLGEELDLTASELATGWTLAHSAVQTAVMGASSIDQVEAITSRRDLVLTQAQVAQVEEIANAGLPVGGPSPEGGVPE